MKKKMVPNNIHACILLRASKGSLARTSCQYVLRVQICGGSVTLKRGKLSGLSNDYDCMTVYFFVCDVWEEIDSRILCLHSEIVNHKKS